MGFNKFRPLRQWGRFNTRVFKEISKSRSNRKIKLNQEPPPIEQHFGQPIYDPLDPNFFKRFDSSHFKTFESASPAALNQKTKAQHPLFKQQACFLFDGNNSLTDGIAQACAIIKATMPSALPDAVLEIPDNLLPTDFERHVTDCIMAGERYDPSLDPLPKKFDPILFWIAQRRIYGTPVLKRNNIILRNLYMKVAMLSMKSESNSLGDCRCDYDESISGHLAANQSGIGSPLVFRHQPHIIIQSEQTLTPLANGKSVQSTIGEDLPDVYPISPLIDLERSNVNNDTAVLPRISVAQNQLSVNTLLWSREQCQKYPWTMEENAANTVCHCFGAALAQANRQANNLAFVDASDDKILKKPLLAKAIQLVDGKMYFAMVQLNTMNLTNKKGVKNLVWLDKACQLYKPKPMHENMSEVEELNMETVRKFVGLLLYR